MTETASLQMPMHALAGLPLGGATSPLCGAISLWPSLGWSYISPVPAAKRRAQMYDSDSDSN